MAEYQTEILLEGLAFPEGPRWHDNALWFTDQHARRVYRVANINAEANTEIVIETEDLPGGLGWLSDGSLLVVYMTRRQVMRLHEGELTLYADLYEKADFHCNDMVVDAHDRVYVGNFGFDLHGGGAQQTTQLVMIDADRQVSRLNGELLFPNGCVIPPQQDRQGQLANDQLIVAETFAHRLTAFTLTASGALDNRQTWAELGDLTPDGICLDHSGAIWLASPGTGELIRVAPGGQHLDSCQTVGTPYACMLGGEDRRSLYVCSSETDDPATAAQRKTGRIEQVRVKQPGVGLP